MARFRTLVFNTTFALNCGLLFLLFFEQRLHIPVLLQVFGRMHPLVLHFPIVLAVLAVCWELVNFFKTPYRQEAKAVGDVLLLATAFTAVVTSLMGLFLSREEGYAPDALLWHKWGGVVISAVLLGTYAFRYTVRRNKVLFVPTIVVLLVVIILTGHLGANITHGQDFLIAPVLASRAKPAVMLEDAIVYADMVQPILEVKCNSCHNDQKKKGDLILTSTAALLKGGKNGALWDTTEQNFGLLLQRIHLPESAKKHMPPKGKPQLTDDEEQVLYQWIKSGASFTTKVADLPPADSMRVLANTFFQSIETSDYTFAPADEKKVAALNTNYCVVKPLAVQSPALSVEFFSAAQFDAKQLQNLVAVKDQVVSLNLAKMPVQDGDLKNIAAFKNLRRLNLSFTSISGAGLGVLKDLKELKQLSLSGTKINANHLQALTALPKLSQVYIWNTAVSEQDLERLREQQKNISWERGFKGDTVVIKLNPPSIENETPVFVQTTPLKLKHYIKGVEIRYTTDGSEPDSLKSPVYKNEVILDKNVTVKTKAYKPGWISSDVATKAFFKAGVKPDSAQLLHQPNPQYKSDGARTLTDGQKGEPNNRASWLGFRDHSMEAVLYFSNAHAVSSVTISNLIDVDGYILPPQQIEVWGGASAAQLRLLKRMQPQQPVKDKPNYTQAYELQFPSVQATVLKVVIKPVPKLPAWHPGKGDKGWIFVDEVFVN
ncbi:MAG TPA: FN3 associated domain-containing protein [Niastella sp.]|nr:FN3 associated domain-containing protein [Niastella sp.]